MPDGKQHGRCNAAQAATIPVGKDVEGKPVRKRELARGLAAGFLGGMAAGAAMSAFSALWARVFPASRGVPLHYPPAPTSKPRLRLVKGSSALKASQQEWDSTESAAQAFSRFAASRELSPAARVKGAIAVHFAVSAAAGALYGATAEAFPHVTVASGAAFGAGMWLVAQELAMPALGWSRPLKQYSIPMQANSLGEHLAYGITTELVRQALRKRI